MAKEQSATESSQTADAGRRAAPLRLRVLLGGFDAGMIHQLRHAAAQISDAQLQLFSRRRSDFSAGDAVAGRYDVILLHAGAFSGSDLQLEEAIAALVQQTPVVVAGTRGDVRYTDALIQAGCAEVLSFDETDAETLLLASIKAAARRSHDEDRDLRRAALQSLEQMLGRSSDDDEPILILDDNGNVSFANRSAQELGFKAIAELVAQVTQQRHMFSGVLITRLQVPDVGGELREFTVTSTGMPVDDRSFTILRVKTHESDRLGDALEQRFSLLDSDTGLPSRPAFLQRLDERLAEASLTHRHAGLILLQIDQMAGISEALGYDTGKALLNLCGQRLRVGLRREDWLGYLGDSVFAIAAADVHETIELTSLVEKLRQEIGAPMQLGAEEFSATASIGIAGFPNDGISVTELLHHADLALARARAKGGDTYEFFDVELGRQLRQRWEMQTALRLALERDEFWIAFQPVMDAAPVPRVSGAEALLRWHHPTLGPQSPADFVPILEQAGLIHRVGEWVLRQSCDTAQRWRRLPGHESFRVSVNLSPVQLRDAQLPAKVRAALAHSGLPPSALALELTENVLLERTEDMIARLDELAGIGVGLHIDDFGTGFSSIAYLKRLPVTGLKIDRAFVHDVSSDPRDQALVRCMVELARIFGLETVAEGVENDQDQRTVIGLGVNRLQGFHYSMGIAADLFEQRFLGHA